MDKVRPIKIESEDFGQYTEINPDEDYISCKGITLEDNESFSISVSGGELRFTDSVSGVKRLSELTEAGTGITVNEHEDLDHLVHSISENSYYEVTRTDGKVSNETWWIDSEKTTKIREADYTRTDGKVSQIATKQYDVGGSLIETYTESITRTDGKITSITGVIS